MLGFHPRDEFSINSTRSNFTTKDNKMSNNIETKYGAGKFMCELDKWGGFFLIIAGAAILLTSFSGSGHGMHLAAQALGGCFVTLVGAILLAAGQLLEAQFDTADQTREMLNIMLRNEAVKKSEANRYPALPTDPMEV